MGTRVAQKAGEIKQSITEGGAAVSAAGKTAESVKGDIASGDAISPRQLMNIAAGTMASASVPKHKIDSSLIYQDSKRREYSLTFHLAITSGNSDPEKAVFEPIRRLEELSCAQVEDGDLIGIQYPAIFKVFTRPGNIIKINHAAITSVIPT